MGFSVTVIANNSHNIDRKTITHQKASHELHFECYTELSIFFANDDIDNKL